MLLLILVVVISLAIKQTFFNSKEGLLTSTMITKIEEAIEEYESEVEKISSQSLKRISSAKLTQAESVTFSPILADEQLKTSAKIDKIIELKPTSDIIKDILADTNARKYKANLLMLNRINKESYPDDEAFTKLLESVTGSAYNVVSGENSAYPTLFPPNHYKTRAVMEYISAFLHNPKNTHNPYICILILYVAIEKDPAAYFHRIYFSPIPYCMDV